MNKPVSGLGLMRQLRTLFRWQGKMEPCTTRDKPATELDIDKLAKDVESAPDDYQWERAERLGFQKEPSVMA